jgi:hypothetical protein
MVEVVGLKKYGVEETFNGMTSLPNVTKYLLICSKVINKDTLSDRQTEW